MKKKFLKFKTGCHFSLSDGSMSVFLTWPWPQAAVMLSKKFTGDHYSSALLFCRLYSLLGLFLSTGFSLETLQHVMFHCLISKFCTSHTLHLPSCEIWTMIVCSDMASSSLFFFLHPPDLTFLYASIIGVKSNLRPTLIFRPTHHKPASCHQ